MRKTNKCVSILTSKGETIHCTGFNCTFFEPSNKDGKVCFFCKYKTIKGEHSAICKNDTAYSDLVTATV